MAIPVENAEPMTDLARFDEEWTKTSVSSEDVYADIPDGVYDAIIEEACLNPIGRPQVIWKLRITGPQAVDRTVIKSRVITENTLGYLKEELEKCGVRVSRLSELPASLKEVVDRPIGLAKRTKDGRVNFYFNWSSGRSGEKILSDDLPF